MDNQEKEARSFKSEYKYLTPRQKGTNPRAKGTNPRALKLKSKKSKRPQKVLRTIMGRNK